MHSHDEVPEWRAVATPPLKLREVDKEAGTQGSIYLLWRIGCESVVCAAQSLPALIRWLNEQQDLIHFRTSSMYRVSRCGQNQHHGWRAERHSRQEIGRLNARLMEFKNLVFLTRSPDSWKLATLPVEEAAHFPGPERCLGQIPADEPQPLPQRAALDQAPWSQLLPQGSPPGVPG